MEYKIEMFYLNSTLNFGIPTVMVFQLVQQKGTTARYSNKTSLLCFGTNDERTLQIK